MKIGIGGSGISGISTALFLKSRYPGAKIEIFESSNRIGGWINTTKLPSGEIYENGTRTLSLRTRNFESFVHLIRLLPNFWDRVYGISKTSKVNKNRYVIFNGRPHRLPSTPIEALLDPLTKGIPIAILKDLISSNSKNYLQGKDVSVYDLFSRFDKNVADYLVGAFIHGVYGGNIREWSAQMAFREPFRWKDEYGSFIRGFIQSPPPKYQPQDEESKRCFEMLKQFSLVSFDGGMQVFVDMIKTELDKLSVDILREKIIGISSKPLEKTMITIETEHGTKEFDYFISCIPAHSLTNILTTVPKLKQIEFTTLAPIHVTLPLDNKQSEYPSSFGILSPKHENEMITGIIFDSQVFPQRQPQNTQVLTIMATQKFLNTHSNSDSEMFQAARDILSTYYKPKCKVENLKLHYVICKDAIPKYKVGHEQLVKKIRKEVDEIYGERLILSGSSFDGIGVPDCIKRSFDVLKVFNRLIA